MCPSHWIKRVIFYVIIHGMSCIIIIIELFVIKWVWIIKIIEKREKRNYSKYLFIHFFFKVLEFSTIFLPIFWKTIDKSLNNNIVLKIYDRLFYQKELKKQLLFTKTWSENPLIHFIIKPIFFSFRSESKK